MVRVAVNGLGRIGRAFVKLAIDHPNLEVVAVNELGAPSDLVYLMRYDSVYGRYAAPVAYDATTEPALIVAGHRMRLLSQRDPMTLPWRELDVDVVVESTGAFPTYAKARAHLAAGARHVVLAAPAKDEDAADARTVLVGVNLDDLRVSVLSSNGSCTTNSASPVMQVLNDAIGIRKAFLNTVHGYTASQSLVDGLARGNDARRGRAAAANIVPSTTGAAVAVGRAIPSLRQRFDGIAMRVPVLAGSMSAMVFLADRTTSVREINDCLSRAATLDRWSRVLAVTSDPVVSSDIIGEPHAAIVDLSLTKVVDGDLCAVCSWYDNEFGYANSLLAHVEAVAAVMRDGERLSPH